MSSVETGQMFAVETGQMTAADDCCWNRTEDATAAGLRPAAVMSSVETG